MYNSIVMGYEWLNIGGIEQQKYPPVNYGLTNLTMVCLWLIYGRCN
jgi:hypothetical protein